MRILFDVRDPKNISHQDKLRPGLSCQGTRQTGSGNRMNAARVSIGTYLGRDAILTFISGNSVVSCSPLSLVDDWNLPYTDERFVQG